MKKEVVERLGLGGPGNVFYPAVKRRFTLFTVY